MSQTYNKDYLRDFESHLQALSHLSPADQKKSLLKDYENGVLSPNLMVYSIFMLGLEGA